MKDLKVYSNEGLSIIKASEFLKADDLEFLLDNKSSFQEMFEKKKIWRSSVDMRVSVLNDVKFPDKASKYWQCVRECDAFYGYLVELSFDFRRNKIKLENLNRKIKQCRDDLEREMLKIDIEELEYIISNQTKQASERVREIREWIILMEQLDDGSFDTQDIDKSQLLSYSQSFIKKYMINKDNISGSEKVNLIGLLVTSLRYCQEKGVIDDLMCNLNEDEKEFLQSMEVKNSDNSLNINYEAKGYSNNKTNNKRQDYATTNNPNNKTISNNMEGTKRHDKIL